MYQVPRKYVSVPFIKIILHLIILISYPVYRPSTLLLASFVFNYYDFFRLNSNSCSFPLTRDYCMSKSVSDLDSLYLSAKSSSWCSSLFSSFSFSSLSSFSFVICSLKLESVLKMVSALLSLFSLNENSCFSPAFKGLVMPFEVVFGASSLSELRTELGNFGYASNPPNMGVTGAFGESLGDESSSL